MINTNKWASKPKTPTMTAESTFHAENESNRSDSDGSAHNGRAISQVDFLKQEIDRLNRNAVEMKAKLEEAQMEKIRMNTELDSLRKFVNVTDKSHGSEVSGIIKSINDNVYQLASDIVQDWPLNQKEKRDRVDEQDIQRLSDFVSSELIEALIRCPPHHPRARMLLQYSIQAYLQCSLDWLMRQITWDLLEKQLRGIDKRMRVSESQVTYGRWRALTSRYLQEGIRPEQEKIAKLVKDEAPLDINFLGQFLTGHLLREKKLDEVVEDTNFTMSRVIEQIFQLANILRQDIISCNFDLYCPLQGQTFHSSRYDLPVPLSEKRGKERDVLVATLRIGSRRVEKVGRDHVEGAQIEGGIHDRPQVITKRLLGELLNNNDQSQPRTRQTTRSSKDAMSVSPPPRQSF